MPRVGDQLTAREVATSLEWETLKSLLPSDEEVRGEQIMHTVVSEARNEPDDVAFECQIESSPSNWVKTVKYINQGGRAPFPFAADDGTPIYPEATVETVKSFAVKSKQNPEKSSKRQIQRIWFVWKQQLQAEPSPHQPDISKTRVHTHRLVSDARRSASQRIRDLVAEDDRGAS